MKNASEHITKEAITGRITAESCFTACRVSLCGNQLRSHFVRNLTHTEARDTDRFPTGPQTGEKGERFVWQYGLNDGDLC